MLLATLAALHAVQAQNARYAWLATGRLPPGVSCRPRNPAGWWFNEFTDEFRGYAICCASTSPPPARTPRYLPVWCALPEPGQYLRFTCAELLLAHHPADQLGRSLPRPIRSARIGRVGAARARLAVVVVGRTPTADVARCPQRCASAPSHDRRQRLQRVLRRGRHHGAGSTCLLGVVSAALLFPILVFSGPRRGSRPRGANSACRHAPVGAPRSDHRRRRHRVGARRGPRHGRSVSACSSSSARRSH